MNSVLENSYAWTGSFVDAINRLSCDVASLIFSSLTLTPDPPSGSESSSSGGIPSTSSSPVVASGEKALPNFPQVLQEAVALFAFDDFQYLLLKIFLAIILSNVILIYIAWYIYGARITERFMTDTSPEELKQRVLQLKLPREHSQRHS